MNTFLTLLVPRDFAVEFAAHLLAGILSLGLIIHAVNLQNNVAAPPLGIAHSSTAMEVHPKPTPTLIVAEASPAP